MAARGHINNFSTTINESLTAIDVNIDVLSAAGVSTALAALPSGGYIPMTIDDNAGNREIIWVTGVSSNTLTAARGQEGTTAQIWALGTPIECRATAQSLDQNIPIFQISATSGSLTTSLAKVTLGTTDVALPSWIATSRYTPLKVGYYYFEAYLEIQNVDVDSNLDIRLLKNATTSIGTVVATKPANGGSPPSPTLFSCRVSGITLMNGTSDFMELHARHTGTGSKTINKALMLGHYLRG